MPEIPILSESTLPASNPSVRGWMQPRLQGAKQSMRKHFASSCKRRPTLDLLEDRDLLSGVMYVIGVSPPPAIVTGLEPSELSRGAGFAGALLNSPLPQAPDFQHLPMPGPHHDFGPLQSFLPPELRDQWFGDSPVGLVTFLRRFPRERALATAVEYGIPWSRCFTSTEC